MEIFGLALFLLSGLLLVALITADKNDPSFTNISNANVSNWLGPDWRQYFGSIDFGYRACGVFLALVPLFWGFSYFRKKPVPLLGFRLLFLPISLVFLAGGLFALDGAGVSDIGGGGGAIIIGFIMRFMQAIPSVLGLKTIHYVGIGTLFLGFVGWLWVTAISRQQWLNVTGQTTKFGRIFKGLFGIGPKFSGLVSWVQNTLDLRTATKNLKRQNSGKNLCLLPKRVIKLAAKVASYSVSSRAQLRNKKYKTRNAGFWQWIRFSYSACPSLESTCQGPVWPIKISP